VLFTRVPPRLQTFSSAARTSHRLQPITVIKFGSVALPWIVLDIEEELGKVGFSLFWLG
jgi:hypothetical protein